MTTFDEDQSIRVPKTHEIVAERLRRQIVSGKLAIGDRLPPEEDLTATFGIARTTLREALRVLESQGLIEIRRGRGGGPVVTQPSVAPLAQGLAMALQLQKTTLADFDLARQFIEPTVVAHLALTHTARDIESLRAAVERASDAAEANNREAFGSAAARFHETILEASANNTLATLSLLLQELVQGYYYRSTLLSDQPKMRRAVRSYRKLIDLIVARDAKAAQEHWRKQMAFTISDQDGTRLLDMYSDGS